MKTLRRILAELLGLFVEDRLFAAAIALWLLFVVTAARVGIPEPTARGGVLFTGLAVILIAGIVRGARSP